MKATKNQIEIMKKERLGETKNNEYGNKMTIIEYINSHNVKIKFENGYITKSDYRNFKKGIIRSPYDRRIYEIGYIGEGKYQSTVDLRATQQYDAWNSMLKRCYSEKVHVRHPTYKDCTVCEEWHNFQNFAKWYDENYYEVEDQEMCLDKDILVKGNKVYSPDTCIFVPERINILFVKGDSKRGDLPIGVSFHKISGKYTAQCNQNNKKTYLGLYDVIEDAFYFGYKPYKEKLIQQIADEYKDQIPKKLYDAMYSYIVEITD